ncbi:nitroreductase family protein [Salinarimonas soli]|uniref:NADPH-dependent oxidoreductase n=1 Tax=Salinarimonas soli TaxID=1638099 RepID=A0A5B2VFP8_9HYPH|nr:nitroreductase family protein [Salinarimonas soli]KAA2237804.1 NADPH-dependent oxidoreductase [Salinarimonas soli]
MPDSAADRLNRHLARRFGEEASFDPDLPGLDTLARMAGRGSCRAYREGSVDPGLLRMLCAVALSTPSKSDLQQRDIVIVADPERRLAMNALVGGEAWVAGAPALLVFCGNNRRQRQIHEWRGRGFANDHLDAFFNAAVDAGIALSGFVAAAETVGLGCCPVSAVRNRPAEVSDLLGLPDHVFPVAGLAVGWPEAPAPVVSPRLPLGVTVHMDRFGEEGLRERVEAYDRSRAEVQPYARQRYAADYGGPVEGYCWSDDKTRQYARPERTGFGAFIRGKGFDLA